MSLRRPSSGLTKLHVSACCCSDGLTRERGLQALARWLASRQHVSELDMRKIWKGLFYAFWHSDKAPVQVAYASQPAAVLLLPCCRTAHLCQVTSASVHLPTVIHMLMKLTHKAC